MPIVDILCLANSRKHGGRCIAGLRADGTGWIRLVSREPNGVLFDRDFALRGGSVPRLLDLLRIRCSDPHPGPHHPEDWYITVSRWELLARPAPVSAVELLRAALAAGPALLGDTKERLAYLALETSPLSASLALLAPDSMNCIIAVNPLGERTTGVS